MDQDAMWQLGAQNGSKKKEGRDAMRWLVVRNGSIEGRVPVDPVDPIGGCLQGTKSRATHPQRIIRAWRYAYHRLHHHHCHRRHHRLHRHYYDISNIYHIPPPRKEITRIPGVNIITIMWVVQILTMTFFIAYIIIAVILINIRDSSSWGGVV